MFQLKSYLILQKRQITFWNSQAKISSHIKTVFLLTIPSDQHICSCWNCCCLGFAEAWILVTSISTLWNVVAYIIYCNTISRIAAKLPLSAVILNNWRRFNLNTFSSNFADVIRKQII